MKFGSNTSRPPSLNSLYSTTSSLLNRLNTSSLNFSLPSAQFGLDLQLAVRPVRDVGHRLVERPRPRGPARVAAVVQRAGAVLVEAVEARAAVGVERAHVPLARQFKRHVALAVHRTSGLGDQ